MNGWMKEKEKKKILGFIDMEERMVFPGNFGFEWRFSGSFDFFGRSFFPFSFFTKVYSL